MRCGAGRVSTISGSARQPAAPPGQAHARLTTSVTTRSLPPGRASRRECHRRVVQHAPDQIRLSRSNIVRSSLRVGVLDACAPVCDRASGERPRAHRRGRVGSPRARTALRPSFRGAIRFSNELRYSRTSSVFVRPLVGGLPTAPAAPHARAISAFGQSTQRSLPMPLPIPSRCTPPPRLCLDTTLTPRNRLGPNTRGNDSAPASLSSLANS